MEHTVELTEQQLNVIGMGLAELPFKIAQPVMAAIQEQLDAAASEKIKGQKKATVA